MLRIAVGDCRAVHRGLSGTLGAQWRNDEWLGVDVAARSRCWSMINRESFCLSETHLSLSVCFRG